ncbi:MAG: hypothetical protein KJ739_03925 [Nitrospinae bacterium]|nr:hypothetical protein [Nitrospinota bacterium]
MGKKHRLSTIFSFFFDPRVPLLFLIGTFVMAVAGNAAFGLILKIVGGESTENYLKIIIGAVIALILIVIAVKLILISIPQGTIGGGEAFEVQRKGIIYTAGKQTDTIKLSLDKQQPVHVGFLCSKESEPFVDELIRAMGFDEDKYIKKIVNDPENIVEIRTETKLIIDWMLAKNMQSNDVAIDVTGGKTTMSIGVYSMAEELKIDTQYIKSDFDENNKPIKNTQRGVFVKRYSGTV